MHASGRVVLFQVTDSGKHVLRRLGRDVRDSIRSGGIEHEYWRYKTAEHLEAAGYEVRMEEPVNGYADIVAVRDGRRVAIEVETGKSNWRANLAKNESREFGLLVFVATKEQVHRRIQAGLKDEGSKRPVSVVQAQELEHLLKKGLFDEKKGI